ncbi:MAG: hypothetical protein EPN14_03380 [Gallionella sp.]|nr:MAG: hypothetical protein EPN14_03380 [Gallionella sp.]
MKLKRSCNIRIVKLALAALFSGAVFSAEAIAADAAPTVNSAGAPPAFAKVGDAVITRQDYDAAFAAAVRNKFYHGRPPEAEVAALQREVGDKLVANVLLLGEAKRRGLEPDGAAVAQRLEQHEQRNRDNKQWQEVRTQWLPVLTTRLQEESLLGKLESAVRNVPPPDEKQLREYYTAHPEKFTEPEQLRVSIILLSVDPSSPQDAWNKARELAQDLVKQLHDGADFEALARKHSGDANSAEQGGDMGYLHGGMLPDAAQEAVDKLKPGETSDPVRLLEGIIILRPTDRKPPKLGDFEVVRERASDLWLKEESERVWKLLIAQLKEKTSIQVDESNYLPIPAAEPVTVGEPAATGEQGIKK